jgi:hypothetical protein
MAIITEKRKRINPDAIWPFKSMLLMPRKVKTLMITHVFTLK